MAQSKAALETAIRNEILNVITSQLTAYFDTDVMDVSASELTIPMVDAEGNECYALIKVSIPRGSRVDGGYLPYDGYAAHEEWKLVKADRAMKAEKRKVKAEDKKKAKQRKAEAKKVIKALNTKGFEALVHEGE